MFMTGSCVQARVVRLVAIAGVAFLVTGSPAVASSDTDPDDATRIIEHAMGETEVPAHPERVVVLDSSFLDSAIALGVTPVGATEGAAGLGLPAYLPESVHDDVAIVGETNTPNLEAIAELDPDLIIGARVRHEALYEDLQGIAPTVFSESSGTNWTSQVTLTGDALNLADDVTSLLDQFDARAADVGAAIGAADMTATIVRFLPDETRLYGPGTFSGSVLTAVGFDLGDKPYADPYSMAMISAEQIELLDADVIFATTYGVGESSRPVFEELWDTLSAVQSGNQFDVRDDIWMTGIGVLGANLILDDLESMLG